MATYLLESQNEKGESGSFLESVVLEKKCEQRTDLLLASVQEKVEVGKVRALAERGAISFRRIMFLSQARTWR